MGLVLFSNRLRCLNQVAAICLMGALGAGCSSDFSRFDLARYTASISDQQASDNQANLQPQNPYPDVDTIITSSINRPGISTILRPPQPASNVPASNYDNLVANQRRYQYPATSKPRGVGRLPVRRAVSNNDFDTYNDYKPAKIPTRRRLRQPRIAPIVNSHVDRQTPGVDPVTTSAILPLRRKTPGILRLRRNRVSQAVDTTPQPLQQAYESQKPAQQIYSQPQINPQSLSERDDARSGWTKTGGTAITMKDGETLHNISKRYGVPVNELKKVNNIDDGDRVYAGQRIIIPTYVYSSNVPVSAPDNNPTTRASRAGTGLIGEASATNMMVPTRSPIRRAAAPEIVNQPISSQPIATQIRTKPAINSTPGQHYTVVAGDNLGSIANIYGLSVNEIMAANDLQNSNIRIGQTLVVPGRTVTDTPATNSNAKRVVGVVPRNTDTTHNGLNSKTLYQTKPYKCHQWFAN